jgi:hypothetical protein
MEPPDRRREGADLAMLHSKMTCSRRALDKNQNVHIEVRSVVTEIYGLEKSVMLI